MLKVRSIFEPDARAELLARIDTLRPGTPRRWGRMKVEEMVVHLSEGYLYALERPTGAARERRGFARVRAGLMRRVALDLPVPWPRGAPAPERVRVDGSLRPAGAFAAELGKLREAIDRFSRAEPARAWPPHPLFGHLSTQEWGRWAWRHADHHLRQFGA